jgi:hypothetical protein
LLDASNGFLDELRLHQQQYLPFGCGQPLDQPFGDEAGETCKKDGPLKIHRKTAGKLPSPTKLAQNVLHMWKTLIVFPHTLIYQEFVLPKPPTSRPVRRVRSERAEYPKRAVISFDRCEAAGLTYGEAAEKMCELESRRIAGLCLVTAETAARLRL